VKLIAETAWHHDGDFDFFKDLVENLVVKTKADFIKFHISLDADEYIHTDHPAYDWVVERLFTASQWTEIINYTIENGKKPMLLFNDKKAIEFGMQFSPELVEIHSVCLNDINLLNFLKEKIDVNTIIVLGVGGSTLYEIENAINILETRNIVLMHGFQNYPTNYEDINLSKIKKIMQLYPEYRHGYADHTAWDNENNVLITLFGAALEMDYIEKHVSIVTGKGRTDWQAAISINLFNELTAKLEILSKTFGNTLLRLNDGERAYAVFGPNKKAAILTNDVSKDDVLSLANFVFKRTGQLTDLSQIDIIQCLGKRFNKHLPKGHCITRSDIA
jgi:N,N'-diacetyllegionaminate synthase